MQLNPFSYIPPHPYVILEYKGAQNRTLLDSLYYRIERVVPAMTVNSSVVSCYDQIFLHADE